MEAVLLALRIRLVLEHDGESRLVVGSLFSGVDTILLPQYLTHHYLIDLVAGGSLTCAFFYYYLSKMPDELRHPTTPVAPYRARASSSAIPLDEESGLPRTFAHTAAGKASNGHANGYGGWESDDAGASEEDDLAEEARLFGGEAGAAPGRDSFDVPLKGDMGTARTPRRD